MSLTGLSQFKADRKTHSAVTLYPRFDMTMQLEQFSSETLNSKLSDPLACDVLLRLLRKQKRTFFSPLVF